MKRTTKILFAIMVLALAALACNAIMGGGGGSNATATPSSKVILSDDFSSSKWGTGTDKDSSIEYVDNALQMIVYTKQWFVWSTTNAEQYQNVHIEVTVKNNGSESTTAFGIICDKQPSKSSFYYLVITPAGQYVIARAVDGESDVFLTNNNKWAASDAITQNASSYRMGADCGNGTLALYVDGKQVDSVSDTTYSSGGVALMTWSGNNPNSANVSFDDFVMTELP